jgi:hypothetical protein
MKFDLTDTGNSSSSAADSNNLFDNLLGSIDIDNIDQKQDDQISVDEDFNAEKNIYEILNVLSESSLKLDENTINDIKIRLRNLFEKIKLNVDTDVNVNTEQAPDFTNENFIHLMKFLKELGGLLSSQPIDKNKNRDLDLVLDKVRTKLNEQLKIFLEKKVTST